ncbi:hypothetical protein [Coralloluteibacterium stylophorae]|uniref:Serine/threonine protein kinase n=1 Tax=Coralloluteibacterium stylophorae TaxID=1776034 RepID=A0A8J7VUJ6_9GAMM|nr:hypothetical protein [Coralloluteibacterium stylophorae]MBS7458918.1 hypothetical protein [Coralloluteibacterium stylophorae]
MSTQNTLKTLLMTFGAVAALTACGGGADDVASPGEGSYPPPPTTTPTPPPPTTPTPPPPSGGAAEACPEGFDDLGTFADDSLRSCLLPTRVVGELTVPYVEGVAYYIRGRTDVGQDQGGDATTPIEGTESGTLTIEPGVTLYGASGSDFLVVNRGSQLVADGEADAPIVFTSRQNLLGTAGEDSIGQWGGLVILGRAPINTCPDGVTYGSASCETQVEGTNAFYGGNAEDDSSGTLRYMRVQYSGFAVSADNELQNITLAGVGAGTTIEYVQVHNSSDDGIEFFGGTVNASHMVFTGNDDDSIDTDSGWNGAMQYGIVIQRANGGDRMNEMSSASGRTPASNPKIANFTYVGNTTGGAGIVLNSGTDSEFYNVVVTRPDGGTGAAAACLDVDDATTMGTFESVFFSCPTAYDDDADGVAQALFEAGSNNVADGTSTLSDTFVNGANENGVTPYADLESVSDFFENPGYIGAVQNAGDTWWQGWTCGLDADTSC